MLIGSCSNEGKFRGGRIGSGRDAFEKGFSSGDVNLLTLASNMLVCR
jgi:hypothetical protein